MDRDEAIKHFQTATSRLVDYLERVGVIARPRIGVEILTSTPTEIKLVLTIPRYIIPDIVWTKPGEVDAQVGVAAEVKTGVDLQLPFSKLLDSRLDALAPAESSPFAPEPQFNVEPQREVIIDEQAAVGTDPKLATPQALDDSPWELGGIDRRDESSEDTVRVRVRRPPQS